MTRTPVRMSSEHQTRERYDLATRLEIAEAASARYGWLLHVIENADDDPPLEQPGAFLNALRDALGR